MFTHTRTHAHVRTHAHTHARIHLCITHKHMLNYVSKYYKYLLVILVFLNQARFWVQVISELRRGVKLKKVEANLGSRVSSRGKEGSLPDYKLTPYENLMDDIRERRYHLRKTPPTSSRKDTHAIILEFIRSRPRLKKARSMIACL